MTRFYFMGVQEDPEFDTIEARGITRIYDGTALDSQRITVRTVKCACSRRYTPAEFAELEQVGVQKVEGETDLRLANCGACGSTISMEEP